MHMLTYLFIKALWSEAAALEVLSYSVHQIHSSQDEASQPRQSQQHDGTTSQRPRETEKHACPIIHIISVLYCRETHTPSNIWVAYTTTNDTTPERNYSNTNWCQETRNWHHCRDTNVSINTLRFYVSVCVCVCEWRKWDVRGAGLDYSDARPSYFNFCTEPRTPRRMFENIGPGYGLESSMQSGSSSRSGCNRASSSWSGRNRGAVVEADAIDREQQLKRAQSGSSSWTRGGGKRGAAVEVDAAIGPGSSSWSGRKRRAAAEADATSGRSSSSESCPRRITHGRRTRGK